MLSGVAGADLFQILGPALLGERDAGAQAGRQQLKRRRNQTGEDRRSLAAAQYQNMQPVPQNGIGTPAQGGEPAGADAMDLDAWQRLAESSAALVGHQADAISPRQQRAGKSLGRKHMAAGAPGSEKDEGSAHASAPSPMRRRVSERNMPMASASANSEEPP